MAMTTSNMLALGHTAANFSLPNTDGNLVNLADFKGNKGLVVAFICNHCPYVIHIAPQLAKVALQYQKMGIAFVAINSNDIEQYPDDNMSHMIEEKRAREYPFPYLLDEKQEVAKAYSAACTPDIYLFNADSSKHQATGSDLIHAMDTLLDGRHMDTTQTPSMGCNIKWKPENEPN
jgi:peroxiredoxin